MKLLSTILLLSFSIAGVAAETVTSTDLSAVENMLHTRFDVSQSGAQTVQSNREVDENSFIEQVIENTVEPKHQMASTHDRHS